MPLPLLNSAKNLLALCLGSVLALLFLEAGLRLYNPFETRIKGDRIVLPVDKEYRFENTEISGLDNRIVHTKNNLGFRGPDIPATGLDGHLSIVAVGGSTTECFYLSDGNDWPALLGDSLAQSFKNVWVNNAGLDGHSTFGHTILLKDFLVDLKPKIILLLVGINDVGREGTATHAASVIKGDIRTHSVEGFVKSLSAYSEAAALALNVFRYLRAWSRGLPHKPVDVTEVGMMSYSTAEVNQALALHRATYLPNYEARLNHLVREAQAAGIDPVLITQPVLFGSGVDAETSVDLEHIKVNGRAGFVHWTILQAYNAVTKKVGEENNLLVIDLANEMEKSSTYFYDFVHFTNAGAAEVARIVYNQLQPYLARKYSDYQIH